MDERDISVATNESTANRIDATPVDYRPEILAVAGDWICLIETDEGIRASIEPFTPSLVDVDPKVAISLADYVAALNIAASDGLISFTPGIASLKVHDMEAALSIIAPNVFDVPILNAREAALNLRPFAFIHPQVFPPGVALILSGQEVDELIGLIVTNPLVSVGASVAGVTKLLIQAGMKAHIAGQIAVFLVGLRIVQLETARRMSPSGRVAIKVLSLPPFLLGPTSTQCCIKVVWLSEVLCPASCQ